MGARCSKAERRGETSSPSRPDVGDSTNVDQEESSARPLQVINEEETGERSPNHGPQFTGLLNMGNTCFLNSILQVLFRCPFLSSDLREMAELSRNNREVILNKVPVRDQETAAHQLEFVQSLSDVLQGMADPRVFEQSSGTSETSNEDVADPRTSERSPGKDDAGRRVEALLGGHIVRSSFMQEKQNEEQAARRTTHEDTLSDKTLARIYQAEEMLRYLYELSESLEDSDSEEADCFQANRCYSKTTLDCRVALRKLIAALRNLDPMFKGMGQQDPQEVLQLVLHQVKEVCHLIQAADATVAVEETQPEALPGDAREEVRVDRDTLEGRPAKKRTKSRFSKWTSKVARRFRKLCRSSSRRETQGRESEKEDVGVGTDDCEPSGHDKENVEGTSDEHTSRKNGHNMFLGQMETTTCCLRCGNFTSRSEEFFNLGLCFHPDMWKNNKTEPIPLEYLFNFWAREEHLDGENMFVCSSCNLKVMASSSTSISTLPSILALHLKQFQMDRKGEASKLEVSTSIPEHLSLRRWCSPECLADDADPRYTLHAIIEHAGRGLNSGHYTTYVNTETTTEAARPEGRGAFDRRDKWVHFNDERVTVMGDDDMQKILSSAGVHDKTPYLVFYKRTN